MFGKASAVVWSLRIGLNLKKKKKEQVFVKWVNQMNKYLYPTKRKLGKRPTHKDSDYVCPIHHNSFCPTPCPIHRMLQKCWMNEQTTNGWQTTDPVIYPQNFLTSCNACGSPRQRLPCSPAKTPHATLSTVTSCSSLVGQSLAPSLNLSVIFLIYILNIGRSELFFLWPALG